MWFLGSLSLSLSLPPSLSLSADTQVFLNQSVYLTHETKQFVEICFSYIGKLERIVEVLFSSMDVDAVQGEDYQSLSVPFTFDQEGSSCINVTVEEDSILEDNETFQVVLLSSDPAVNFSLSRADVIIEDSNCKHQGWD